MVVAGWITILIFFMVFVYVLDVDIDETREGKIIIWYTKPFSRTRDKLIF